MCTYSSPHCPGHATNTRRRTNLSVHTHVTELAREQDLGTGTWLQVARHARASAAVGTTVGTQCPSPLHDEHTLHSSPEVPPRTSGLLGACGVCGHVRRHASARKHNRAIDCLYQGLEPRHWRTTLKVCQMAPPLVEIVVMFKLQGPPPQPSCGRVVGFCVLCFSFVFVSLSTTSSRGDGLFHSLPTPGALAQLEGATTSCACSQSSSLSSRHHHRISLRLKWHLGAQ
jgi:hypothetical protein